MKMIRRLTMKMIICFNQEAASELGIIPCYCGTLPETNSEFAPENRQFDPKGNENVFQPSIFRTMLVSGSVTRIKSPFGKTLWLCYFVSNSPKDLANDLR